LQPSGAFGRRPGARENIFFAFILGRVFFPARGIMHADTRAAYSSGVRHRALLSNNKPPPKSGGGRYGRRGKQRLSKRYKDRYRYVPPA